MENSDAVSRRDQQADVRDEQAAVREDQAGVRDEQILTRETIVEDREFVADRHHQILHGYLKIILWATAVLIVLVGVVGILYYHINRSVQTLDNHTIDLTAETDAAKDAAVEARDTLQAALKEFEERRVNSEGASPTAIRDALLAVARIETHLCGGPCVASLPKEP